MTAEKRRSISGVKRGWVGLERAAQVMVAQALMTDRAFRGIALARAGLSILKMRKRVQNRTLRPNEQKQGKQPMDQESQLSLLHR